MKSTLTKLFWPILKFFETGEEPENFKPSHRMALNGVGGLFLFLAVVSGIAASGSDDLGGFIPVVVFFAVGFVAVLVGTLGTNKAVAKIWGTGK
ncbi:hypothetical protein HR060_14785 [Catenovulum sp. SM1970]|uniref:hypothetical protein n=1 Tax=Marinifaba aquimaris TaxID=2741323 RepID=UPI00157342C7|nr:hypothetical protein [Marinifaba aquimaris]NTS78121.1 hypothetical protein [Marinifaba aquimaris]